MTEDVRTLLPHRPPFLFLDGIEECTDTMLRGWKEVTWYESFVKGHYPGNPIMPGVLICECLAQAGAAFIAANHFVDTSSGGIPVLTRLQDARFRKMVKPGNRLALEVTLKERVGPAFWLDGVAKVDGQVACRVTFACTLAANPATQAPVAEVPHAATPCDLP